jgi:hypothetical protein
MKLNPYLSQVTKIKSKWIKDLNVKNQNYISTRRKQQKYFRASKWARIFLDKKSKAQEKKPKTSQIGLHQIKMLLLSKVNNQQSPEAIYRIGENICKLYF